MTDHSTCHLIRRRSWQRFLLIRHAIAQQVRKAMTFSPGSQQSSVQQVKLLKRSYKHIPSFYLCLLICLKIAHALTLFFHALRLTLCWRRFLLGHLLSLWLPIQGLMMNRYQLPPLMANLRCYVFQAPKIQFRTRIYHCNINRWVIGSPYLQFSKSIP